MPILNIGKVKNLSVFTAPVNVTYLPDGTVVTTPAQGAVSGAAGGTSLPTPVEVDAAGESADEATAHRLVFPGSSGDAGRAPRTGAARYGESGSVQCSEDATHGLGGNANELQQDEGNVQWVNNYWEALGKRPQRVYFMETTPRGKLLIINNERFDCVRMKNREGTQEDAKALKDLFEKRLGFHVEVANNCKGEEMRQRLRRFASDEDLKDMCACAVAILSHGGQGDIIYGCDGSIEQGVPKPGTYIHKSDLREIFGALACPAMIGKPKLFIVQACRGVLEDTAVGPRRLQPDLTTPECSTDTPNYADQYFLFATVENYVAYRNKFVKLLVGVFEQHAGLLHIKDLATELHNEMSKFRHQVGNQNAPTGNANQQITDHIFTMGEACGTLTKHWYLNPLEPSA